MFANSTIPFSRFANSEGRLVSCLESVLVEIKLGMLRRDGCSSIKGIGEIRAIDLKRALTLQVLSLSFSDLYEKIW